jgi:ankyrin repeat protein
MASPKQHALLLKSPKLKYTVFMQTPTPSTTARLFTAIQFSDSPAINEAIKDGADLHSENLAIQKTPLEVALSVGVLGVAVILMKAGCTVRNEHKALHYAVEGGNAEILELILDSIPQDSCTKSGDREYTPLIHAARLGRLDMCRLLISRGSDPKNAPYGRSIIVDALSKDAGHTSNSIIDLVQFLLEKGSPVNPSAHSNRSPLGAALDLSLKFQNYVGEELAVRLCELLIKHGADVNATDSFGAPLHRVAMAGNGSRGLVFEPNLVPLLVKSGADVNISRAAYPGPTPLHWAAMAGNAPVMKQLMAFGALPSVADENGRTPLHWASNTNVARLLLDAGVDQLICDKNGKTAELISAEDPDKSEVYTLLRSLREQAELDISISHPGSLLYRHRI